MPHDILRANINALIDAAKEGRAKGPDSALALEAASGVGKSTIYRILDPREPYSAGIVKVQAIAEQYGLQAWQLLVPQFDPASPPVILTAAQREEVAVMRVIVEQVEVIAGLRGRPDADNAGAPSPGDSNSGTGANPSPKPKRPKTPRP